MEEAKLTLQGMTVKVGEVKYTIPITSIRQSMKAAQGDLLIDPNGNEMLNIQGEIYNLVRLYEFFQTDTKITSIDDGIIMLLENGDERLSIFADEIIGETEITVCPLPAYLPKISGISGCSIVDGEEVCLIVEVSDFFEGDAPADGPTPRTESEYAELISGEQSHSEADNNDDLMNKYFTFEIDGEEYGLEVANVKEIIGVRRITAVPATADYIEGIISLRGEVIPVVNVRKRFRKARRENDSLTCVIVANYGKYTVGLVVDCVKEVVYIGGNDISPPPSAKRDYNNQFISKLGKIGENVKLLIDLERFLFQT